MTAPAAPAALPASPVDAGMVIPIVTHAIEVCGDDVGVLVATLLGALITVCAAQPTAIGGAVLLEIGESSLRRAREMILRRAREAADARPAVAR